MQACLPHQPDSCGSFNFLNFFNFLFLRENDLVLVVTVFVASKLACLCSVVKRELNECGSLLPQFVKEETVRFDV
jgi:hypothetical protein